MIKPSLYRSSVTLGGGKVEIRLRVVARQAVVLQKLLENKRSA